MDRPYVTDGISKYGKHDNNLFLCHTKNYLESPSVNLMVWLEGKLERENLRQLTSKSCTCGSVVFVYVHILEDVVFICLFLVFSEAVVCFALLAPK